MATVLFVHNNFPAQFRDLALQLAARGVRCGAIRQLHGSVEADPDLPGVPAIRYGVDRSSTMNMFYLGVRAEADFIRASRAYGAARKAQAQGFNPDLIIGHTGWGETLLLDEVWPEAKQILYPEFFYAAHGLDVGFDPEFKPPSEETYLRAKAKNATGALALTDADALVCPTKFQASTLPKVFQPLVRIIHEGVDLEALKPGPAAPFPLDDGRVIQPGTPVITHINNNMEPLRGLHVFARALPRLMAEVPEAQVLIIGATDSAHGYGGSAIESRPWRETCFAGVEVDPARLHFLGKVAYERMVAALRLSTAHVYYSYPFVLSWSAIEALALGCYVIGSATPPVEEVIEDGVNGTLLPFFDVDALSEAMIYACRHPDAHAKLRRAARKTAERLFDRTRSRQAWLQLIEEVGVKLLEP